jgi:hypothetical protein
VESQKEQREREKQYPLAMMVILSLYCYATGRMPSRAIEEAAHTSVAARRISGNRTHPDHLGKVHDGLVVVLLAGEADARSRKVPAVLGTELP